MPIILLLFLFFSACSDDVYYDNDKTVHQKDCIGEIDYENRKAEISCEFKEFYWLKNESDTCLVKLVLIDNFGDEFSKETNREKCPTEE